MSRGAIKERGLHILGEEAFDGMPVELGICGGGFGVFGVGDDAFLFGVVCCLVEWVEHAEGYEVITFAVDEEDGDCTLR